MGRPKGSKNKSGYETETVGTNSTATLELPAPTQSSGYDLVLGIRRIRGGPFTGLWELSELSVDADKQVRAVRIMTDANIKPILIAQIGAALSRCR
jgi:hypothetical protein